MKMSSIFKKASVFAIAVTMVLLMVVAVLPAVSATDEPVFGEKLVATNIAISGGVKMQYYFTGNFDENNFVKVTYPDQDGNNKTEVLPHTQVGNRYLVEVPVTFAQQTTPIQIQWCSNKDGVEQSSKIFTKTALDYAKLVFKYANDPGSSAYANAKKMLPLVTHMLNMGAQAQIYNDYNTEALANEGLFAAGTNPIDNMSAAHFYDYTPVDTEADSTFTGTQVFYQEKVSMRVYLNTEQTYALVSNGTQEYKIAIKTETSDRGAQRKYVAINNIGPTNFNARFTVTVDGKTFSYSVLDHAYSAVNSPFAGEDQKNIAKSLYLFYAYTKRFTGANVECHEDGNCTRAYAAQVNIGTKDAPVYKTTIVCPDCGKTEALGDNPQIFVTATGNTSIRKGETGTIKLTYAIVGNTELTALSLTPTFTLPEGVTVTCSATEDDFGTGLQGTVGNNHIINHASGESFATTKLLTVTYRINATNASAEGTVTIDFNVSEAVDANVQHVETAKFVKASSAITVNITREKCSDEQHEETCKYVIDGDAHYAYCKVCGFAEKSAHILYTSTIDDGKLVYESHPCVCGITNDYSLDYSYNLGFDSNKDEKAPLLLFTPSDMMIKMGVRTDADGTTYVNKAGIYEDGSYITFKNTKDITKDEGWVYVFNDKDNPYGVTGQYLMIKYRTTYPGDMQIFAGANNGSFKATGNEDYFFFATDNRSLVANGEWQVAIFDLSALLPNTYKAETEGDNEGQFQCDYLRFDVFNINKNAEETEVSVDVAYIAMSDDLMSLASFNGNDLYRASLTSVTKDKKNYAEGTYMASTKTQNVAFDADWIATAPHSGDQTVTLANDGNNGDLRYTSITANGTGWKDSYVHLVTINNSNRGENPIYAPSTSGAKYLAVVYRTETVPAGNKLAGYANSTAYSAKGADDKFLLNEDIYGANGVDGNWRVAIADLSNAFNNGSKTNYFDPEKGFSTLRFDYWKATALAEGAHIADFAFIGVFETEEDAYEYCGDYLKPYVNAEGGQGCMHDAISKLTSTTWTTIAGDPQNQSATCISCDQSCTRTTDETLKGLTLFTPDEISKRGKNNKFTGEVVVENGFKFYRATSTAAEEGYIALSNTDATLSGVGRYVGIMARKIGTAGGNMQLIVNLPGEGTSLPSAANKPEKALPSSDGEWVFVVFDINSVLGTNDSLGWLRLDLINTAAGTSNIKVGDIVDVAWVGFFNTGAEAYEMFDVYKRAYDGCDHHDQSKLDNVHQIEEENSLFTVTADCNACGAKNVKVILETIEGLKLYTPGEILESYKNSGSNTPGATSYELICNDASVNNMPYVRFTAYNTAERYVFLQSTTNASNYLAILYRRTSIAGNNDTQDCLELHVTAKGTTALATGNFTTKKTTKRPQDGEWVLEYFDISSSGRLGDDGSLGVTRFDIFSKDIHANGDIVDVAYIAFFTTEQAAQEYYHAYIREYLGEENCPHTYSAWEYVSNAGTEYAGTRYAVEGRHCTVCDKDETRPAVIAYNIDGMNAADSTGTAADFSSVGGSGSTDRVTDPTKRVIDTTIYLRNNQFIVAAGWVGIHGDFDTANAYYRILDENGNPLTDWVEKAIANTTEKEEGVGSYNSIKSQLGAHGVTDFVARGFKTNNLNTIINGKDYASFDKPIAIEYAVRSTSAPEGSDLITLIVFKNIYKVKMTCSTHTYTWQYVENTGSDEFTDGYAVEAKVCRNCGDIAAKRYAVIAYNFDSIAAANSTGATIGITGVGTGGGAMVTDLTARVTTQDSIYLRENETGMFVQGSGWIGINGDFDITNGYYRILDENGEPLTDWTAKPLSSTDAKPDTAGSYTSVKNQLSAHGVTAFVARGFNTNNLYTNIDGTEYASYNTPISIEYALKATNAPEGSDLITVIVFKNLYKACLSHTYTELVGSNGTNHTLACATCGKTTEEDHTYSAWEYVSNAGTEYAGTRYAVEGRHCTVCDKDETRPAVIAFNIGGITAADSTGANATLAGTGTGDGAMVYDPAARVTTHEAIYLRNNQFIVATGGWVGIHGDFDTANAYYRILDENGNPLTDWVEKIIYDADSNVAPVEKPDTAGSYASIKRQLGAHGVTDFVARGFKTNNLNTTIDGIDYAKYDKPIAIEYALRSTSAPAGSDLIRVIIFKNVYKACAHSYGDWSYVSGVGTEWEGTGYAVQGRTCSICGKTETRAAVIAFNFDSVAIETSAGADGSLAAFGTGGKAMVTDPDARVTTQDVIYLRNNQFLMGSGWLGVAGEIDINNAYYRILNNETGEVILDWQTKVISDSSSSSIRPQVKPSTAGSYTQVQTQLGAQGITDFTAYGFRTNNLVTKIGGVEYASKDTPIAIEYAVKIVGAPEGYDLIRVIIFKNVYMY